MKTLFKLLAIVLLINLFNSCEEEQIIKDCEKCLPMYILYEENDTTFFTYNSNNQIIEINYLNGYSVERFEYNEKNQLVRFNEYRREELDNYILYEYENGQLQKSLFYYDFKVAGEFELNDWEEYEHNSNGDITKSEMYNWDGNLRYYITYEYDSKGNVTGQKKYSPKNYNPSEIYLDCVIKNKYGDAFYYYKDLDLPINHHYKIFNILTEQKIFYYDSYSGEMINTSVLYMNYNSFNEYGYPTSVSKASENRVWAKYEKILYKIIE